ncbi:MAG: uroporphyrinogen decarboxylase [Myxococcaceae bacterium]
MDKRARFLAAVEGKPVDRPPVWLMRQAGRYLPDYRAVRAQHGFWDVCHTPELSTRVALEPLRLFELDAAIVFSDILIVPQAMDLDVTFGKGEGPQIAKTLKTEADLAAWNTKGLVERLKFMPTAITHLRDTLKGSHGILGFAGAPFTLFAYITEGQGSDEFKAARVMLHENRQLAKKALATLGDCVAELLEAQFQAGADIVQLFDTWGGLLTAEEYGQFCVPAIRRITDQLHARGRKVLLFVRGGSHLMPCLGDTGCDGFSLDWRIPYEDARARFPNALLQGNIDPVLLFSKPAAITEATQKLVSQMKQHNGGTKNIVNLGHGIMVGTPPENVKAMVDAVVHG